MSEDNYNSSSELAKIIYLPKKKEYTEDAELRETLAFFQARLVNLLAPEVEKEGFTEVENLKHFLNYLVELNVNLAFQTLYKVVFEVVKSEFIQAYLIKLENIRPQYWEEFKRRNLLIDPTFELNEKTKQDRYKLLLSAQKDSLSTWIRNLEFYKVDAAKSLWVLEGLMYLGSFNTRNKKFSKRGQAMVNPFPKFNSNYFNKALEYYDAYLENTDALDEIYTATPTLQSLSNKQKIKFQDVYAKISAHHYKRLEFKGLEGGEWKVIPKGDWKTVQKISEGTPWCLVHKSHAVRVVANGPFHYYTVHGQTRVGLATIETKDAKGNTILKQKELRGIEGGSQDLDKEIEESGIVKQKQLELGLRSDIKHLINLIKNWKNFIDQPVELLKLLSCNQDILLEQIEYDEDVKHTHKDFINYVKNNQEEIVQVICSGEEEIIASDETYDEIDLSFYRNPTADEIRILSLINGDILIHLDKEFAHFTLPNNIHVVKGFAHKVIISTSDEIDEEGNYTIHNKVPYENLKEGTLEVETLVSRGNGFPNTQFLPCRQLILQDINNKEMRLSDNSLHSKCKHLVLDNVNSYTNLEGQISYESVTITNTEDQGSDWVTNSFTIKNAKKVKVENAYIDELKITNAENVFIKNTQVSENINIKALHCKLDQVKASNLNLLSGTSNIQRYTGNADIFCANGILKNNEFAIVCLLKTNSLQLENNTAIQVFSPLSSDITGFDAEYKLPFYTYNADSDLLESLKLNIDKGVIIDAKYINEVDFIGEDVIDFVDEKVENILLNISSSEAVSLQPLKDKTIELIKFRGIKKGLNIQFGNIEAGKVDLSNIHSAEGIDFGELYTDQLNLKGLRNSKGLKEAFAQMQECDRESQAGIETLILPLKFPRKFKFPNVVKNIKYVK